MGTSTSSFQQARADHLPRDDRSTERHPVRAAGAILGIVALVVGVPAALIAFVGDPLPQSMPTRSWLTASVTTETVLKIFAVLVWLVWAHFVVCLVSEWHAIRHGRVPTSVIFGGGPQAVARRLIATALLLTGAASVGQGFSSHGPAVPRSPLVVASAGAAADQTVASRDPAHAVNRAHAQMAADRAAAPTRTEIIKYYTVAPPHGRHYDTLWDIAERHLGDPLRYKEIFALNHDRVQADGRRLVDANLIQPGWELRVPADAHGPGIHTVASTASAPDADGHAGDDGIIDMPKLQRAVHQSAGQDDQPSEGVFAEHGKEVGGALVLAGILLALTGLRGPHGEPTEDEGELRLAANSRRSSFIDRALRQLAESRRAQDAPMPDVAVAYANDDQLILHVVGDCLHPTAPWAVAEDGRSWSVRRDELSDAESEAAAPYPALVAIARSHGYDLLVDLEYAPGLIAVTGDDGVAREVVASCAADLSTHAWSDHVAVTVAGFADSLGRLGTGRVESATDIDSALDVLEDRLGAADRLIERLGVSGVLEGRARTKHRDLAPQVLLLSAAPTTEQQRRIARLQRQGRSALTVLSLGNSAGARWRFTVDAEGTIDLGVLGVNGQASRWTRAAGSRIEELIRAAETDAVARASQVAVASPAQCLERPAAEVTAYAEHEAARPDAPVQVRLLGAVEVTAPGPVPSGHRDILTETVVMAALHPQGLHPTVFASSLWPRGVEEDVVESVLAEAQAWLGSGPDGDRLQMGDDGLWHLSDEVYVDHAALVTAAAKGDEDRLLSCLEKATGEVFSQTPGGRYTWLAFLRGARDARTTITAFARSRAAALVRRQQRDRAIETLEQALLAVPTAQLLWRERLKLIAPDDPDERHACLAAMFDALRGTRLDAETASVVEHVDPKWERDAMG